MESKNLYIYKIYHTIFIPRACQLSVGNYLVFTEYNNTS